MKNNPPKRLVQFLRWFCREDYLEEIEGDLTEIFRKQYESSPRKAKWRFGCSTIKYFRPEFVKLFRSGHPINPTDILHHNFLITYRTFLRYKSTFFINLIGLSSGLTTVLLIYLWVYNEMSFDKFHKKDDRLFQVMRNTPVPSNSEWRIVRMLSGDFTIIILIAIIISLPASYFLTTSWLSNFAYRIEIEWWFFAGSGLVAILIAWLTIGIQTIKAARINPVECLKSE